jgi:Fe-S cluster assembly iron-binding protein IscA
VLALTPDAATAIRAILDASPLDDDAGLRISPVSQQDGQSGLELAVVEAPDVTDEVLTDQGIQVFLAPPLAEHLDDRLLHARVEEGRIAFELLPQ